VRVLLIEDHREDLRELENLFKSTKPPWGDHYDIVSCQNYKEALVPTNGQPPFDILVTDMKMGSAANEGLEVLRYFSNRLPIAIVITGYPTIRNCVDAMKAGAWDYIEKYPPDETDPYERLNSSIHQACQERRKNPERGEPNPDSEWINEHYEELSKNYPGSLVAVLYGKVVDSDITFAALAKRIELKYPLTRPTIVYLPGTQKEEL
jgi:DNA-binding NtrC family response regulator